MLSRVEDEIELLERHIEILRRVFENEPIGIIKLSELCSMPQHKIRYSLRLLEQSGMIRPSQRGAVTTDLAKRFLENLPENIEGLVKSVESLKTL